MITESKFHGGSKFTTIVGAVQLYQNSNFFQIFKNTSGSSQNVTLPSQFGPQIAANPGGLWLFILNDSTSTQSVVVKKPDTTTLVTLSAGEICRVWMGSTTSTWYAVKRTINTARTESHSTFSGISAAVADPTYSPFCFEGTDCEYANALPLNGEDGRAVVLAPMFQDVSIAKNWNREAIRAADVVMPNKVVWSMDQACFEVDPLHPLTKTLSPECYQAIFNDGHPYLLDYYATAHGLTRNPYHIHWNGTSFTWDGAQQVKRHIWRKVINYTAAATGVAHTVEIRFVMEHTVSAEPVFNRCGGGGKCDSNSGALGAIFAVYVFASEINQSWVEGSNFQAAGSADAALSFTKDDPFVNGAWHSVDPISKKFCHPQIAMACMLVTRFHSPLGVDYVPLADRDYAGGDAPVTIRAHNRWKDYRWDNGSPWTTSFPYTGSGTVFRNICFGHSTVSRTMSLGGDLPRSTINTHLCWENGAGIGRTFFKPLEPGWDEAEGTLSVSHCGELTIPIDCYGTRDSENPSETNNWHLDPHPCKGHPDEPFENYGGSHRCFNNYDGGVANSGYGDNTKCCIGLTYQLAESTQKCTKDSVVYDSACAVADSYCEEAILYSNSDVMPLKDYDYQPNGSALLRIAEWERLKPDPDQVNYSYAYDSAATSDLLTKNGTWTLSASTPEIACASVAGSGVIRACLGYDPGAWANEKDCTVSAQAQKIREKGHGVLVKGNGSPTVYGYGLYVKPVTPGAGTTDLTVQLCKYNASGKTVLATATITAVSTQICDLELNVWGTDLQASVTPFGGSATTLSAEDLEFTTGYIGVYTEETTSTNIEFDSLSIQDESLDFVSITAYVEANRIGITFPNTATSSYGKCADTSGPCGASPYCDCTSWSQTLFGVYGASKVVDGNDIQPRVVDAGGCTAGDNPTWAGGDNPGCCEYTLCTDRGLSCETCPGPYQSVAFIIISSCAVPEGWMSPSCDGYIANPPKMCSGIAKWEYADVICV